MSGQDHSVIPWHAVLLREGERAASGVRIASAGLDLATGAPMSLLAPAAADGMDVRVGQVSRLWRDGAALRATGVFAADGVGADALAALIQGRLNAVEAAIEDAEVDEDDVEGLTVASGRLSGLRMVASPPFPGSRISLGADETDLDLLADDEEAGEALEADEDLLAELEALAEAEDDDEEALQAAAGVSEAPWDGSASRFNDEQWARSCVLDRGEQFSTAKTRYGLPIREPGGALSRAGVHAAAGRLDQVDASPEAVAKARRALVRAYAQLKEEPPESLTASLAAAARGPGWITHPSATRRIWSYWVRGKGAAKVGWGSPGSFRRARAYLAKYVEPRYLDRTTAQWYHDATGRWPGRRSQRRYWASRTASGDALLAAVGDPVPAAWFADPKLAGPTPLTVEPSGQVFGHAALWGTCHVGRPGCVTPPRSLSGYAYFLLKPRLTDAGAVSVGSITIGTGHAGQRASALAAAAHYDNTGTAVADVVVGEDEHGIWMAGATRAWLPPERLAELAGSVISGDWRTIDGSYELIALLGVNVPGFPVPRKPRIGLEGVRQVSLVAAGLATPAECGCADDSERAQRVQAVRSRHRALLVEALKERI